MKEKEFKALVSLLEDDDPGVEAHVESQLVSMGESVIPRLEQIWEIEDNAQIQERIEDIIHVIQSQRTVIALREWINGSEHDLLQGWFLVTQFQFAELDFTTYKNEVNRLVNRIWLEMREGMNIPERLLVINKMIFERDSYKPNAESLYDPLNYYLNGLIETKKGSPISLGILYIIICESLNINVGGIILPGYFVLTYKDQRTEFFVDVFNKGTFFIKNDLKRFLKEMKQENNPKFYQASSKIRIIMALIRSISQCYRHSKQVHKVREWERLIYELEQAS